MYPLNSDGQVSASPSFPTIEKQVLAFWAADDTFQASVDARKGCEEWVFYDGPPFANGLPHYGHLLTGYAKDVFPRYQTMRGKLVDRVFGWDTHGLPAELEVMKQLGMSETSEIEAMGIDKFNAEAKASVLRYTQEWEEYVNRQARWVDFENGYKTLDIGYMESVIWAFKTLYDKNLAYEGYRVLPYCWKDETPLSNHELRMDDDVYQIRQDQAVTVTFPLTGEKASALGLEGVAALAWTTTPWTLPTNLAIAAGPDILYSVVPVGPKGASENASATAYLLAKSLVGSYAKELGYESAEEALAAATKDFKGSELENVEYQPLFDFYTDTEEWGTGTSWRILVDDYVADTDGTGLVHQAPAYGEDDKRVADAYGLPTILSLDDGGIFLQNAGKYAGQLWQDANREIVKDLREAGRLLKVASYAHSYPHCWRCRNPLIYKAVSSWFVKVSDIKDRLLAANEQINWVPENVKYGQFGKWLEGARDWSISRNRYWGSPIPVWKSDNPEYPRVDVYGSLDELERDFGVRPTDLHRPYIDDLVRPNPDDPTGKSMMRRIPDVLDVWFDSGSMPYAQVHYPFERTEWFETHSPADYIVEYIGQTRGWFYVMHVLSVALFDRPAFINVICHGIVLGNDGFKASKSRRNYPDVFESFDKYGSDAVRLMLVSSSILRGGNLVVSEEGIKEAIRSFLLPLWNTWYFFSLYANAANYEAKFSLESEDILDRYILSKTAQLVEAVKIDMDALDASIATAKIRDFLEVLTNWYVRRSRDRFWLADSKECFDTLYTVLEVLTRVLAPLAPLITEEIWKGLTGGRSVHLQDWPELSYQVDTELVSAMDEVRQVTSSALALRKVEGLRVRLPLSALKVVSPLSNSLEKFAGILADELNVKEIDFENFSEDVASRYGLSKRLEVNARAAGPRLGKDVQGVIQQAKAGNWREENGSLYAGDTLLYEGEYELVSTAENVPAGNALAMLPSGGFILLNIEVTADLAAEGLARDTIRVIQDARKSAGLDVSDRIALEILCEADSDRDALERFQDMIATETLATEIAFRAGEIAETANDYQENVDSKKAALSGAATLRLHAIAS